MTDREWAEALLARQESRIRAAFVTYLQEARSERTLEAVVDALQARRLADALAALDRHLTAFASVLPQVFSDVATHQVHTIAQRIVGYTLRKATPVAARFDPSNARAAALMRANRLRFIRDFTTQQRDATRTAVSEALASGQGTTAAARAFRDSIGLTRYQQTVVSNYRRSLESMTRDALSRDLRDRRYDPTVARAFENGEPLTADQIDRMVERYRQAMLNMRADTIARTESLRAMSEGRQEALAQVAEQSDIPDELIQRTWRATRDKRTRDSHRSMDGQTVIGMETPFVTPRGEELRWPGDPRGRPGETINCRCTVTYDILTEDEAAVA